jgi:hypothetical protein
MNTTGTQLVEAIARRLDEENTRCSDGEIVRKLRSLDGHKLNQLVTFGYVFSWRNERNEGVKKTEAM